MSKKPLGALILHGFTSSLDCVREIEPPLTALGLPTRMPVLRGHGGDTPETLRGVMWPAWLEDSEAAMQNLLNEAEKVILIGHSMGALLALQLAGKYPAQVDSLVAAAAALQLASPLAPGKPLNFLVPLVKLVLKKWDMPVAYADPSLAQYDTNYAYTPVDSLMSLLDCAKYTRDHLGEVHAPTLIVQARKDSSVAPETAQIIYDGISTPAEHKQVVWFEKTEHEMFRDLERHEIIAVIADFARQRMALPA
jgi:carboxylesterase